MAKLKLFSTIFSKLSSLTKKDGQIIISKDSQSLYIDVDGERVEITDWIDIDTEEELLATLSPLTNKFYYTKDTHKIWRYINSKWEKLNAVVTWETIEGKPDNIAYADEIAETYQTKDVGILTDKLGEWNTSPDVVEQHLKGIVYGNDTFVTIGRNNNRLTYHSTDGINWTSGGSISFLSYNITYGNGIFVVVGEDSNTCYSTDGINWTDGGKCGNGITFYDVTYGNGIFVTVGGNGTTYHSTDGINWTSGGICDDGSLGLLGVTYGNGMFITVGGNTSKGIIYRSTDGINWTSVGIYSESIRSVTYGNGIFVAVGVGVIYYSTDGVNWTSVRINMYAFYDVTYGNGIFVAMNARGNTYCSTDGINWTSGGNYYESESADSLKAINSVTYGNGIFVAVSISSIYYAKIIKEQQNLETTINDLYTNSSKAAYISSDSEVVNITTPIQLTRNDIADNLTTHDSNKVLSANQGAILGSNYDKISNIVGDDIAEYSESSTYTVGDYCMYLGTLFKCISAINTPIAFDGSNHWKATTLSTEVKDLNSKLIPIQVDDFTVVNNNPDRATINDVSILKLGNLIHITIDMVTKVTVNAGENIFTANIDKYKPAAIVSGHTYTTTRPIGVFIDIDGKISIRLEGTQELQAPSSARCGFTYITN